MTTLLYHTNLFSFWGKRWGTFRASSDTLWHTLYSHTHPWWSLSPSDIRSLSLVTYCTHLVIAITLYHWRNHPQTPPKVTRNEARAEKVLSQSLFTHNYTCYRHCLILADRVSQLIRQETYRLCSDRMILVSRWAICYWVFCHSSHFHRCLAKGRVR